MGQIYALREHIKCPRMPYMSYMEQNGGLWGFMGIRSITHI